MQVKAICVFAGSALGDDSHLAAARSLGEELADQGTTLVYGGAGIGLMGELADAVLARGGKAIGVIPKGMIDQEVAHSGLSELRVVDSMHERKALMATLADAFIALPGGLGTLEEVLEAATWTQLGIHAKPCGLLNTAGFFKPLLEMLDRTVDSGFLTPAHRSILLAAREPGPLLEQIATWQPPPPKRSAGGRHAEGIAP